MNKKKVIYCVGQGELCKENSSPTGGKNEICEPNNSDKADNESHSGKIPCDLFCVTGKDQDL